ncbi:MAG: heat-inducible transcription repressor HrcA [Clostridia bacterium]|nr:heat-inducible transcription repressor HrcA [Clostridia bacterium]
MCGNELSDRKKLILRSIIEAHIETGEPIGSKYLTENMQIACSSATIRNEMAELESLGYLEQPHTSSGRIPSDLGYRFYVDSLADSYALATAEIDGMNELMKVKMHEIDKVLESASKLASSLTNYTGIAIKPRPASAFISRFEIMYLDESNFIIVMLTSIGSVKSRSIHSDRELDRDGAEHITDCLNACFAGLSADRITLPIVMKFENMMTAFSSLSQTLIKSVYEVMNEINGGSLRYSGIDHLLRYPEFSDMSRLGELLEVLERQDDILSIVSDNDKEDISVYIGSESPVKVMNNSSLVFKAIKDKDGKTVGAIGVIGPTRMDYAKVLSTISSISGNISSMLEGGSALGKGGNNLLGEGDNNDG